MQFQKKEKRQTTVRFDSHHVRLRTGEVQRKTGSYMYRWTDKLGKRNTIYAATLEDLREQEEQILVDQHDGIKANIKNVTVNDVYELWCQLKRGIKDSTMKNYIYMYELFVKPTFGKKKLVQVKKSDVRRFYNQLIDDKVLKPSTVDVIHNIVHQVFQIAVDDDMIRSNPAANMLREIKMAHGSEIEKRKALTLEQEELFLGYLARTPKYQHWYPVFYIMANTGMRVGEITGLRWCDVDMENGIISVNHTLVYYNHRDEKGCYFSINTPKTKAGRVLDVLPSQQVVNRYAKNICQLDQNVNGRLSGAGFITGVNHGGYAQCGGHFCLRKTLASANILDVHRHDLLPIYYIKLYYRNGMQCTTVSVNSSLTGYRFGSIIFRRGKCFVSLRTISECGGIHEPKRNASQSQTQSTRGIRLSVLLAICLQPL